MTSQVILVRHGPSAQLQHSGWIDRSAVLAWRDEYDLAGIVELSRPPVELIQIATEATHIVASDMRRAIASAERLAPRREIRVSPLFRETHLYVPRWPTRLPLAAWEMLVHSTWNYRILRRTDATPSDRVQATQAADFLAGVVADGSSALVVTHGVFRRLLAQHLVRLGWKSDGRTGGYDNWSYWRLSFRAREASEESAVRSSPADSSLRSE